MLCLHNSRILFGVHYGISAKENIGATEVCGFGEKYRETKLSSKDFRNLRPRKKV